MNDSTNIQQNFPLTIQVSPVVRLCIAYFSIFIMALGLIGNTISFLIYRFHPSFKNMSTTVFLSVIAITDTISLFEWNLSHFTNIVLGYNVLTKSLIIYRFCYFLQYSSVQVSALTLSVMCIDRYVTVMTLPGSFLHKLPFRTIRSAICWSLGIGIFSILLNGHLLFTIGIQIWLTLVLRKFTIEKK